jgi:autotransporter-associated beta strand protein
MVRIYRTVLQHPPAGSPTGGAVAPHFNETVKQLVIRHSFHMRKPSPPRSVFTAFCPTALSVFAALRSFLALASSSLLAISQAHAGQIWDGSGGDNNWNTAANWDGDVLPTFTNAITFTGNTRNGAVNNLTADTIIGGINLANNSTSGRTNAFTLSGARITLGGDITTTASSSAITDTISLAMILDGSRAITTNTNHNLTVSGLISETGGAQNLSKSGPGTLRFDSINTFSGTTTINAGTVEVRAGTAGGSAVWGSGPITLNQGATVYFNPANQAIQNTSGFTVSGPVNMSGGAGTANIRFAGNDNKFALSGGVTGQAAVAQTFAITQGASGGGGDRQDILFTGAIADGSGGTLGVSVDFAGGSSSGQSAFVNLRGQNTFTGNLAITNSKGLNAGSPNVGAWLTIGGERYNGFSAPTAAIVGNGFLGGGADYSGNISISNGSGGLTTLAFLSSANQTLRGVISGTGSIHQGGSGTLTLTNANTFTGNTTVAAGTFELATSGSLSFVITDTTNNRITGAGTANLNGSFNLNTSAVTVTSGSWTLVNSTTKNFGGTFGLIGFTGPVGNIYTRSTGGQTWTFNRSTGVLSLSSNAIITSFGIPGSSGVINQVNRTIALTVPYTPWAVSGLASLAPTFTLTSGTCNPTSGSPPSPTFASANPATYTVTDGATVNNYTVTVVIAPASTASTMLTCNFGALGLAAIDETAGTVVLTVPPSQSVTSLSPTFTLSANATINPASGGTQNFTNPVVYRVTAENGTNFKDYTVSVQTFAAWAHSGSMFINTTPAGANVAGSVSNFPLLVRLNSSNFNFAQAQSDGRDIRFTTAAGAALPYQIEQWDTVGGRATVWVRIPTITGNSTQEIIMYWGKSGVPPVSSGSSVFNSTNGYASVHHMGDTLADVIGTTTPTNSGTTATHGLIGRARRFTAGQGVQCGTAINGLPTGSGPFSTGVWIRSTTSGTDILGWGLNQSSQKKVVMQLVSPPRINLDCWFGGANVTGSASIPLSEWTHVVHTFQSTGTRLYVNGVLDASNTGGTMQLQSSSRFDIGGWSGAFNFVGDIDEVCVSNVVRSANWVKLEYENQKPLQTLVGSIVQSGSDFSVTPTTVTMNESTSTTLTAQAGGAQKVYWIYKKGAQETLLATDQLTFTYSAPRITGNDSATIQFKAVFAAGTQTIDVPLIVLDTVPDPVFTLVPSTASWSGRQTMTVTANISNLAAMQSAGLGTLNYKWSVSGVAVIRETNNGTLTLTRSQGSGPMTVSLTIDNGGIPISNTVSINVQEPASDPWVERTPVSGEKPLNGQFFARNPTTGLGTIFYNGTQSGTPDTVFLKVYKTPNAGSETLETTLRQALVGGDYAFTALITSGLITYRVVYGTTTGGVDTDVATVTDLVCGDAFVIEGQSNALATDNSAPNNTTTTNQWIRTYGLTSGWGYAISKGNDRQLGLWGWYLTNRLVLNHNMPICIINAAAGGTRIDQHRPNPAGRNLPGAGNIYSIYANLYNRVVGARLTHGIRGLLWHQGEQNQGSGGIDPDYDYKFYQQYFVDISAAWKQDFPNLRNYYFFQIWPAACGDQSRNDQLREVQRTLSRLYSNMKMMSTHGIVPGSSCHYEPAGYQVFSDRIGPLVEQDVFGVQPTSKLTAPNLQQAYFTTPAKNEIALVFDQNVAWNPGAPTMLFLANAAGATSGTVSSGSATGNTIKLQVSGAASAATITYLKGLVSWLQPNILYGSNGIAALTFADVPIAALGPYGTWANGTFANPFTDTAAISDPDGDGRSNQDEFAFGLDPTTGSSVNPIPQQLAGGVFKYTRTKDSGLFYKVYYSTTLSGWSLDAAATQTPAAAVAGVETVIVTLAAAAPLNGKLFVRVEATTTP